ncbi:MAG: ABC transporter substrate-binding protein [Desulfobacterales bacterium]|nr:MAG: ABC transporter substrate-binding protein [Desulfobacterales bacterium]
MFRLLFILFFLIFDSSAFAATIINGPLTVDCSRIPQRTVTLNQAATEIMLALGLEKQMIGTAYMDDTILPRFKTAYDAIPVLAKKYPAREILLDSDPDFVYAGYASGFSPKRGLASREELRKLGISSYLSPSELQKEKGWNIALLYQELREIAAIFHVEQRAETLIANLKKQMNDALPQPPPANKPRILWLDSARPASPLIGAGNGVPNAIITLAGGDNIFADVDGSWTSVSKEQLLARPADIIVLIDAEWDPAAEKKKILAAAPLYRSLEAVKKKRYVEIPFSSSTPGIRVPEAVKTLADAIRGFLKTP